MERGLKERLVGAAVLAALAVIFIPMLLDDAPSGPGPITETNIPERPAGTNGFSSRIIPMEPAPSPVELPEPPPEKIEQDDGVAEETAVAEQPEAAPPKAESEADPAASAPEPDAKAGANEGKTALTKAMPPPATDSSGPSGWIIQLGSFSQEDNARDLNAKLREAGYAAYVEPVEQSGKKVYRVRVGPEVMRGEAEKVRDRIAAKFDLKGIVVRHQP